MADFTSLIFAMLAFELWENDLSDPQVKGRSFLQSTI
jgi:hypothetical protein